MACWNFGKKCSKPLIPRTDFLEIPLNFKENLQPIMLPDNWNREIGVNWAVVDGKQFPCFGKWETDFCTKTKVSLLFNSLILFSFEREKEGCTHAIAHLIFCREKERKTLARTQKELLFLSPMLPPSFVHLIFWWTEKSYFWAL